MVILLNQDAGWPGSPSAGRMLACVVAAGEQDNYASMFMLRPLHTAAPDLVWIALAAEQLAHQMTARWPDLSYFSITRVKLPDLSIAIIAQLTKGKW